jgi:hypothetical protein
MNTEPYGRSVGCSELSGGASGRLWIIRLPASERIEGDANAKTFISSGPPALRATGRFIFKTRG